MILKLRFSLVTLSRMDLLTIAPLKLSQSSLASLGGSGGLDLDLDVLPLLPRLARRTRDS